MLSGPIYRLLIFVATPVSYFRSLYSLFGALYSLPGALSSLFGALYSLSGLCILFWSFVKYPDVSPHQSGERHQQDSTNITNMYIYTYIYTYI